MRSFVSVRVPKEIWKLVKHRVIDEDITLEKWVTKALIEKLERDKSWTINTVRKPL